MKMVSSELPGDLSEELEDLFTRHLRSRVMLKEVRLAEQDLLTKIVEVLKQVPSGRRAALVGRCVDRAASMLVCDAKN